MYGQWEFWIPSHKVLGLNPNFHMLRYGCLWARCITHNQLINDRNLKWTAKFYWIKVLLNQLSSGHYDILRPNSPPDPPWFWLYLQAPCLSCHVVDFPGAGSSAAPPVVPPLPLQPSAHRAGAGPHRHWHTQIYNHKKHTHTHTTFVTYMDKLFQ